ncbi:pyruvate, water dikinase [Prauserella aidingensis]|uniref:rifamycin-inactivating phosphotransferase n=1 Tax=Prauserella aidingensis TaxID=387890 RepID=UPI0020A3E899|nr:rifamycin-inactivating phosphotransferase [Prauserella aidingensis]MCP2254889.1 pyruvate, water dikinase [Prauserella aidingensis]MCP2255608.1 pyruvate, water dikinase [Prauserella aidingensis]
MHDVAVGLAEVGLGDAGLVGGKGAQLGELSRIEGVDVPAGFCVTTSVFRRVLATAPSLDEKLDRISRLNPADREAIRSLSEEIRNVIEAVTVPGDVAEAITARVDDDTAYAVRSSATAEDLPTASFAGQQDTYLNVGAADVLTHVRRCWASLFTERAVTYRLRNGVDHHGIGMGVVVQRMVAPDTSGILFTAAPVTGDRTVSALTAGFGVGEAIASGKAAADRYVIRHGGVVEKEIVPKPTAVHAVPGGGTAEVDVPPQQRRVPALTDDQVVRLDELGRRIEAHFGRPQDIEWCRTGDEFLIVQSRPITTVFPVPEAADGRNRVYVSVGHQQMMTDAMKPLGLSVWLLTTPAPMVHAGGRLFVDVTERLASPTTRDGLLDALGGSDPLIGDALRTVADRDGFLTPPSEASRQTAPPPSTASAAEAIEPDPSIPEKLIARHEESLAATKRRIPVASGPELFDAILEDLQQLKQIMFDPDSHRAIMAATEAVSWLDERLPEWLGESGLTDTLTQSAPNNVTSEMGLALLEVADAIRPHPEAIAVLNDTGGDEFLERLATVPGGEEARRAIKSYLDNYGMRCVGEIDITTPRWSERPSALAAVILGNIAGFEPGEARRRFERGKQEAQRTKRDVLDRLRALPDGDRKAAETERMIDVLRTFIGYREYPKYGMICRYFVYKQALLAEAGRLVTEGALADREDVYFLTFDEFRELARTRRTDHDVIARRKTEFEEYRTLTPPRVLTSDGEAVEGSYGREDLPERAVAGLPVSRGTVEGRARVVLDLADAGLQEGDILVTAYTDPSWSPLFVSAAGLVTEVGGQMTHGAVIAREYGLPAVVGVEHATRLLVDGACIRVDGTHGYVELLE